MRDAALGVLMLANCSTPPIDLAVLVPIIADSRPRANRPRAIGGAPAAKSG